MIIKKKIVLIVFQALLIWAGDACAASISDPAATVKSFFKWYTKNRASINSHFPIDARPGDTTTLYEVNFKKLGAYLNRFKHSGLVSDIFISDIRQKYLSADQLLKSRPQNDGPINDLEVDVIYQTLEEDDITHHLVDMHQLNYSIKGGNAVVLLGIGKQLRFRSYLSKKDGKWVINHITNFSLPVSLRKKDKLLQ